MEKHLNRYILNVGLLISGLVTVFTGLLIQKEYHMGNHGTAALNDTVFGINYSGWSEIHRISIVIFSLFMIFHIRQNWKWYKIVIKKRPAKNIQVLTLSLIFIMVAITGIIPWVVDIVKGDVTLRKGFIEIHDKLALILSVYLVLHVIKRLKRIFKTIQKNRQSFRLI